MRESGALGGLSGPAAEAFLKRRVEAQKLREEIKGLPPEQRAARIREWRETNGFGTMSPEEREARRKMFQKRIEEQMTNLNKKKAEGIISEEETRRLQNMERMLKRLESSSRPALGLPRPSEPAVKPAKPDEPAKAK